MKRKLVLILAALTMTFACLTACGDTGSNTDSSKADSSSTADSSQLTETSTKAETTTTTTSATTTTTTTTYESKVKSSSSTSKIDEAKVITTSKIDSDIIKPVGSGYADYTLQDVNNDGKKELIEIYVNGENVVYRVYQDKKSYYEYNFMCTHGAADCIVKNKNTGKIEMCLFDGCNQAGIFYRPTTKEYSPIGALLNRYPSDYFECYKDCNNVQYDYATNKLTCDGQRITSAQAIAYLKNIQILYSYSDKNKNCITTAIQTLSTIPSQSSVSTQQTSKQTTRQTTQVTTKATEDINKRIREIYNEYDAKISVHQRMIDHYRSLITGSSSGNYDSILSQLRTKRSYLARTPGKAVELKQIDEQIAYYENLANQSAVNKEYERKINEEEQEIEDLKNERDAKISALKM